MLQTFEDILEVHYLCCKCNTRSYNLVNYYMTLYTDLHYRKTKPEHHWKAGKNLVYRHSSIDGMVTNKCSSFLPVKFHVFINRKCCFILQKIIYKSVIVFAVILIIVISSCHFSSRLNICWAKMSTESYKSQIILITVVSSNRYVC